MKNKRIWRAITVLCVIVFFCIYAFLYFQKGITFEGKFLKLNRGGATLWYEGSVYNAPVRISTEIDAHSYNSVNVTYELSKFVKQYKVEFLSKENINIYQNDSLIFEGMYMPLNGGGIELYEKNGMPYLKGMINMTVNGRNVFNESYQVGLHHIVKTAAGDNRINRGNPVLFFISMLLLLIFFIDIRFPRFFFYLKYSLSINEPEPSDLYVMIQKGIWYVMPFVITAILIASLIMPL